MSGCHHHATFHDYCFLSVTVLVCELLVKINYNNYITENVKEENANWNSYRRAMWCEVFERERHHTDHNSTVWLKAFV